jgi:hypothetical protein
MSISSVIQLNQVDFTDLDKVKQFLAAAKPRVTFGGIRMIGSFRLDDVAQKINSIAYNRFKSNNLTLADRVKGLDVFDALRKLYKATDEQIQNSNPVTRLFSSIGEFSITPLSPRFHVMETSNPYQLYKIDKYVQEIGPLEGSWGTSSIIAEESEIREKAQKNTKIV